MNLSIQPRRLSGTVPIPSSKSMAHRGIICAALSGGISYLSGVNFSKDIEATLSVMEGMGAHCTVTGDEIAVSGITSPNETAVADCCESGSTLRFLIPVAAALGIRTTFCGQGRLPQRPITPYLRELTKKGITFDYQNTMPFTLEGRLQSGSYALEGDISSQFITGLLFALPLLEGDSEIVLTSPLQSKPYADMTIACMAQFGVQVEETASGYRIPGGQRYQASDLRVEGDFSQAAFFYAANALGNDVTLDNIPAQSVQGDRVIVPLLQSMYQEEETSPLTIDATDIPDLVPILCVAAGLAPRPVRITGAARLRIKESDRLETTASLLHALGGKAEITEDGLIITPVSTYRSGTVDSAGDHRIAMCAAIAATRADGPVTILGAECVEKSYPAFFDHYERLLQGKITQE